MNHNKPSTNEQGFSLLLVLSVMIILSILSMALITVIISLAQTTINNSRRQQAFNISEAGINYYLWHLSHNPTDFKDGKTTPATPDPTLGFGPYVHDYIDDSGVKTGTYTLWIKPQGNGSTIATVRSIGKVSATGKTRTIEAQLGVPSFASYVVNADTALWFGNTEKADGPIHSNVGIRMDGESTTDVTSSNASYVPPSNLGGNGTSRPGVWCDTSVTSPVNCNTRNKSDWRYPVASIDYNQVTSSLCKMKKTAFSANASTASLANNSNACSLTPSTRTATYIPRRSSSYSATRGYLVQLNPNGTYDLLYVNGENDRLTPYNNALTLQSVATNIPIDDSGVIYVEDNVWVRTNPTFHGRVSIGAGRLSTSNNATATFAGPSLYSAKDGSDVIGVIAEGDVIIAPYAPPATGNFNFEIDAAVISQNGGVQYLGEYNSNGQCTRGWGGSNQTFKYYGSLSSRQTWTWLWLKGSYSCGDAVYSASTGRYISGILNSTTQYDYNLLYAPPPSFPITSTYNILSWREVLTAP